MKVTKRTKVRALQTWRKPTPEEITEANKDAIVNRILYAFQSPDVWPLTDQDRVGLLRELYRMALESVRDKNFKTPLQVKL